MSDSVMTITKSGSKLWKNSTGQLHRTDGPAVEWWDGDEDWYINGKKHRINGPAIARASGENWWYENGRYLGFSDEGFWALWDRLTPEQKQDPVLLSHLPGDFNV
jgi:hypothetical protein